MFRLVTTFSLLSLLTVSSVGAMAFLGARGVIKRLVFDRLRVTAILKEDALNLWVDNQQAATIAIAQLQEVRTQAEILLTRPETDPAFIHAYQLLGQYLSSAQASRPDLQEVFILTDIGGKILLSTNKSREGEYRVRDKYFTEGRVKTFVQNVYPSSVTGKPTMTVSTPLFNSQGQRIGILGTHLNLEKMDRIVLEQTGLGKSGETYLVDKFNLFVSGERYGREQFPRGVHTQGIDAALQGKNGGGLYLNYAGIPVIGYYRWLKNRELALLVEMHQQEAFAPARELAWRIFLVGLVAVGLLGIGVYLLARQIARPILAITNAAIEVAAGNLDPVAPILTEDEVGLLARAFNQMTKELRLLYTAQEHRVKELQAEQVKSEMLLLNILPKQIAERLKQEQRTIAENFECVTVLFADIAGFTHVSSIVTPTKLVHSLNLIFSAFDLLSEEYGLEKIKTIGDAYMVVGGLPTPCKDHAEAVAEMALEMQETTRMLAASYGDGFSLRLGMNTGPVVAGVIGLKKFSYDLWGDTVNTASRMESHGIPGCIQVTETTYELLKDKYIFEERGFIQIKGKGEMRTYLLRGRR